MGQLLSRVCCRLSRLASASTANALQKLSTSSSMRVVIRSSVERLTRSTRQQRLKGVICSVRSQV